MGKFLRKLFLLLFAIVFVGSGYLLLRQFHDYTVAQNAYDQAKEASAAEDTTSPEAVELEEPAVPLEAAPPEDDGFSKEPLDESLHFLLETNLPQLRQTNEDVLGWIHIPDTQLSYPLLQAEDNQLYLNKSWDGISTSAGSIYLECKSSPDFSDFNTIVYGHRMKDGSMFGSLRNYNKQEYLESHPYVYIVTDEDVRQYEIFSAYQASVVSDTYRLYVEDPEAKQAALDHFISSSVLESALTPDVDDQILTLSTCTGTGNYNYRWVVQAALAARWKR